LGKTNLHSFLFWCFEGIMKSKNTERTVVTLGNAAQLAADVAQNVLGNDVADTFNGSPITRGLVYQMAQSQFNNALSKKLGS
jgi:hypothetical protein